MVGNFGVHNRLPVVTAPQSAIYELAEVSEPGRMVYSDVEETLCLRL